jgi:UDP-glucose 4-epimerase
VINAANLTITIDAAATASITLRTFTIAQQRGICERKKVDAFARYIRDGFVCRQNLKAMHIQDGWSMVCAKYTNLRGRTQK